MTTPPVFDDAFIRTLNDLFIWRRDVRRFKTDALSPGLLDELLDVAQIAPSVGNAQPWRWVKVDSAQARRAVYENFEQANAQALSNYYGEEAASYAKLKLSGLDAAPVQLAVFTDYDTPQGKGLGRQTMPETLDYSTAGCILTFWLAARARGVGVGWVSILEPQHMNTVLDVPAHWHFVGYLCVGWPQEEHDDPELVRNGWQERTQAGRVLTLR